MSLISSPGCSFYPPPQLAFTAPKVTQWLQHLKSSILLPTCCPLHDHITPKEYRFESAHSEALLTAPEASRYLAQLEALPAGSFAHLPAPSGQLFLGKSTTESFLSTSTSLHLSVTDSKPGPRGVFPPTSSIPASHIRSQTPDAGASREWNPQQATHPTPSCKPIYFLLFCFKETENKLQCSKQGREGWQYTAGKKSNPSRRNQVGQKHPLRRAGVWVLKTKFRLLTLWFYQLLSGLCVFLSFWWALFYLASFGGGG